MYALTVVSVEGEMIDVTTQEGPRRVIVGRVTVTATNGEIVVNRDVPIGSQPRVGEIWHVDLEEL